MSRINVINILAVDDRKENLLVLEQIIASPELNIVKAESGNEALGLILEQSFALILMDVQMPEMNGFETAELIRKNKKSREIPIIFVTAISKDEKFIFEGYKSGAVDYITKPFDPTILKSKINVFVQLYEQKQKLTALNNDLEKRVELRTKELSVAKEKAEQANIAKSKFLSNISHELITPLHGIMSFATIGKGGTQNDEDPKNHKYFLRISESSKRLSTLLQDLITLSQFQSGQVEYVMNPNNIKGIIHVVRDSLEKEIKNKSLTMEIKATNDNLMLICDMEKINKLCWHLISNAIKFSKEKGIININIDEKDIDIDNSAETKTVELSIQDQGIGIPDDELEMIFDSFNESSLSATNSGGRGLGLSICREIVKGHKGKIWAKNTPRGAEFKVILPLGE